MGDGAPRPAAWDRGIALLLLLAAAFYLSRLPHNLGGSDEAYFLVEAKRVAGGEVMYRDIFEFIPPGAVYLMAGAFRLAGATMATARGTMAIVHAVMAALLYVTCRRFGVARGLAAVVPLAHLALCQSAWPYASWHWFSSLFLVVQCWVLGRADWRGGARAALVPGLVSGAAIGMQHQRGLPIAAGVGLLLIAAHLGARRFRAGVRWSTLARQLAAYVAGILLVIVPLMLPSLWLAGPAALIEGLVQFPIETYRPTFRSAWGTIGALSREFALYTVPLVLRYTPVALPLVATRLLIELVRGRREPLTYRLMALMALSLSAIASIWYYADFIHIAFIAPVLFVAVAVAVDWMLAPLRRWPIVATALTAMLALGCAGLLVTQLQRNYTRAWGTYRIPHDTAFGRVDFATKWEPVLIDATRAALAAAPGAELFCYPTLAAPYLTTGGKNPTRYQFFDARALPKRYSDEVVALLRRKRVEFLLIGFAYIKPGDPIAQLMHAEYEAVPIPALPLTGEFPTTLLYRRRPDAAPAPGSS